MKRVRGVRGGALKKLAPPLQRWIGFMEDSRWWRWENVSDAPWWYTERALLSLFAGAIWCSKGWAFEEFETTKRQRVALKRRQRKNSQGARGDLQFWWPDSGPTFLIEAKRAELPLKESASQLRTRIGKWLD